MIFLLILVDFASANGCEPGWSYFKNNCYKHIYNPSYTQNHAPAETQCAERGAYLTSLESPEELNFVTELASRLGSWSSTVDAMTFPTLPELSSFCVGYGFRTCALIGGARDLSTTNPDKRWTWPKSNSTWVHWCSEEPGNSAKESCQFLGKMNGQGCVCDGQCNNDERSHDANHFVCKKSAILCKNGAERKPDRNKASENCIAPVEPVSVNGCEPGWSYFRNNCYKHIYNPSYTQNHAPAETQCAERGAYLTSVESPEELNFVTELASRLGSWTSTVDAMKFNVLPEFKQFCIGLGWRTCLLIGGTRDHSTTNLAKRWIWPNSNSTWVNWCSGEPTNAERENCNFLAKVNGQGCVYDGECNNSDRNHEANHFVCKKAIPPKPITPKPAPISCKIGAEIKADGKCGCKAGFFDIADTDCPERRDYKKGEMCISRTPCQNVIKSKTSLSIIFVVDSSQSIGASNWKNMVKFLKSGAGLLDNTIDVGFVQFSTNVTYYDWVKRKWDKNDYLDKTPSNFDAGYTNTPAALDEAREMFKRDRSEHQVAVLITDGMPYVEDILPKEEAMDKTIEAAEKLRNAGVELVALGYGGELQKYQTYLKQILKEPRRDYFEYDKEADHLKEVHMTVLLNKVCSRFQ